MSDNPNINLKSNDNFAKADIHLPLPPEDHKTSEMEIYARFMRHLRLMPKGSAEIRVLSAIQFTSDMLDINEALVSKVLVALGLLAPRGAFPSEYVNFVNKSMSRTGWHIGAPTKEMTNLIFHWDKIGGDKFAAYRQSSVLSLQDTMSE